MSSSKKILKICFLLLLFVATSNSLAATRKYPTAREIQKILLSAPPQYQGVQGYIAFSREYFQGNMMKAFVLASKCLGPVFSKLGWGNVYQGTAQEYLSERSKLFVGDDPKPEYQGTEGYIRYANDHYAGMMPRAYQNVSAVLSETEKQKLGWGRAYHGTTQDYLNERDRLFQGEEIRPQYQGSEGYARYADDFYSGAMLRTYANVSAVLTESEKEKLNWGKVFHGSTKERLEIRQMLFDSSGNIDFRKWFGKSKGLNAAVDQFLTEEGFVKPFNKKLITKVRRLFRAAVNQQETRRLGWDFVTSSPLPCDEVIEGKEN